MARFLLYYFLTFEECGFPSAEARSKYAAVAPVAQGDHYNEDCVWEKSHG